MAEVRSFPIFIHPRLQQCRILFSNDSLTQISDYLDVEDLLVEGSGEKQADVRHSSTSIQLPPVVFASKEEEPIGMLHRAIPPIGRLLL